MIDQVCVDNLKSSAVPLFHLSIPFLLTYSDCLKIENVGIIITWQLFIGPLP